LRPAGGRGWRGVTREKRRRRIGRLGAVIETLNFSRA